MSTPLILVTNDDGIYSPGLRYLINILNNIGKVVVVAPYSPQSAQSHAITINEPISCDKIKIDNGKQLEFICSGTPVDCVKLALSEILDKKPDLCVSGINHGSNASINVIYSGTVSAAVEASIHEIPSVGFSILDYSENTELKHTEKYIIHIVNKLLNSEKNVCLNVNIPKFSDIPILLDSFISFAFILCMLCLILSLIFLIFEILFATKTSRKKILATESIISKYLDDRSK